MPKDGVLCAVLCKSKVSLFTDCLDVGHLYLPREISYPFYKTGLTPELCKEPIPYIRRIGHMVHALNFNRPIGTLLMISAALTFTGLLPGSQYSLG